MSINIGNFQLKHPVILAPMSGVTDFPFRNLVRKLGAGLLVSEMIASRAMIMQTLKSFKRAEIDENTAVQLAGCEPDVMAEAAKMNEDLGARIIDINFGCPAKKVVNGYAGSALMRDEKKAAEILASVVNAVKIPVTLKMRTGWDMENRNAPVIAKIAEQVGIKMITVHGRTRSQMYSGKSDWEFIKIIKNTVNIPVIVNGDIKNFDDISKSLMESNADGVMIGRGVYGRPWFIKQAMNFLEKGEVLEDPSPEERYNIILDHYDSILSYYGKEHGIKIARKHIGWYSTGFKNSSEFRARVNILNDVNAIKDLLDDFFLEIGCNNV